MGWGRQAPLRCELNLLGRPCGAGWVNKEMISAVAPDKLGYGSPALLILKNLHSNFATLPERLCLNDTAAVSKSQPLQLQENELFPLRMAAIWRQRSGKAARRGARA